MYYGVDYYPEHWPKERWAEDARLMQEANINVVRMAEFAWSMMEPIEGSYDFTWLDEAIEIFADHQIKVVLGTPTATPPKWLSDKHDICMRDYKGLVRDFGSRRHYCANNPVYQEYTKKIVAKLSEHYKDNQQVIGWQIDNEFGCHDTARCYCEHCLAEFKLWLEQKYGSIDKLNEAWGTVFWSQTFQNWDQIILPTYSACQPPDSLSYVHNPGLLLDYNRFSSDSIVSYQKLQIDQIRKVSTLPITHNLMGHFSQIEYFDLSRDLDFVSWDNYPSNHWGIASYTNTSMAHDLMRGMKNKNFWVMEQQSGPCGWNCMGNTPKPGQIRLWTYQAVAHGADGIVYFRWRACTFGIEQYWHGVLDHDGIPRRRYNEVKTTGAELEELSQLLVESEVVADVALIKSYDNQWSHEIQPHSTTFNYGTLLQEYYDALATLNISVDVTSIDVDLDKYKLVVMPAFNLMTNEIKAKVEDYVAKGGSVILTFRSGTRNWDNSMTTQTLPGYFSDLTGVEVEEFDVLNERTIAVNGIVGQGKASVWCDILDAKEAEVLIQYSEDYYAGKPGVTVNKFGKGKAYYVGCGLDSKSMKELIKLISRESDVGPVLPVEIPGVEVVKKRQGDQEFLMILNHNNYPVAVDLGGSYTEEISSNKLAGLLELGPYDVAVLR